MPDHLLYDSWLCSPHLAMNLYNIMHALTDLQPSTTGSVPEPATAGLSAGAAVGMSITIFLVSFSVGALLATLITYCCCVKRGKSSGQPQPSTSEGP